MNTMLKRIISLLLCFVLVVGYVPANAFAAENDETIVTETTEPSTEATEPSAEATDPSTEATEPSSEATEPSTEATEPSAETTVPVTEETVPEKTEKERISRTMEISPRAATYTVPAEYAAQGYKVVDTAVIFTDLHTSNGKYKDTEIGRVMGAVASTGLKVSSVTSGGDAFSVNEDNSSSNGPYTGKTATITASIQNYLGDSSIPVNYVWSDHDRYAVQADGKTLLDKTSRVVFSNNNYYVYALSMGDLCSYDRYKAGFSTDKRAASGFTDTVDNAIAAFKADVEKMDKTRPLLIVSHQPLFNRRNDNAFAEAWFDAINEVAEEMDVFFFFGHNHKYDQSQDYYYAKGSSMPVATKNGWSSFEVGVGYKPSCTLTAENNILNFTHLCGGYMDPHTTGSYKDTTTRQNTVMMVVLLRNDAGEEIVNLVTVGAGDEYNANKYPVNEFIESAYDIAENQGGEEGGNENPEDVVIPEGYVLARVEVINQGTTKYFLNETLDTDSMGVEAVYTKENAADVRKTLTLQTAENEDGYTVSGFDMSKPGKQYVTVTYGERTGSFAIEVFETHFENETGSVAVDFTNYGITSVAIAEKSKQVEGYSAYVTYDITPAGYTQGDEATVTIALDTALFDLNRPVKVLDQGAVIATPEIVDGKITFTTNHFSEYDVTQVDDSDVTVDPSKWIEVIKPTGGTTTYTYTLDTDGTIDADTKYLIVTANSGTGNALTNNNGSATSTSVSISDSTIKVTDDSTIAWTFSANNGGTAKNGSHYIRLGSGFLSTSTRELTVTRQGNGAYRIARADGNYYVRYNNGNWGRDGSTASNLYMYKLTGTSTSGGTGATYGQLVGAAAYQVAKGTTAAEALQKVKDGMAVYYTTDKTSTVGNFYDDNDDGMSWTMDTNYDPDVLGTYTVTIKYENVTLGTATVEVIDRVAREVKLDKYEGTVERDSTKAAETGAYLTVLWEGATEPERIPVTVEMLSGSYSLSTNGTYSGLSLTYGGVTFENFTLKVVNKTGADVNDFPTYPNPGSVDVKKSATGVDFQNTGIARVELSASGLPVEVGVDVIVMLDLSSSMNRCIAHDSKSCTVKNCKTRLEELEDAMQTFEDTLKASRNAENIRVAVADFNGMYTSSTSPYYAEDNDETADNAGLNNGEKDKVHTGDNTLTAGAFVSALNLDVSTFTYSASTGTNYDYAFDAIYQLGHAIKKQNAANNETRDLFVLFMSDGAPNQYNFYRSIGGDTATSGSANWNYWLQGTATDEAHLKSLMNCDNHLYFYDWETGNQHRMANAVKGSPDRTYKVIRKSTTGLADVLTSTNQNYIYNIPGLGATMYSIAFDIANDGRITAESVNHVLHNIPSSQDLYYEASEAGALQSAFSKIAGDIAYAATNARYVDQMGDSFNLQLNPNIETNATGSGTTTTTNTDITITTRPVYTEEDAKAGKCPVADIGKPYGNGTTVENVKFTAGANGSITATTTAGGYKLPNGTTVTANSTNILVDGVIYGKNFFYNNNNTAVTVTLANGSTYSLPGETFYWNIGTINETLYTISYTVYLEGSMDGDGPGAGTYDTNNFAVLYYTNHVGNEVNKSVPSPALAWKGANVSYAFYLVNDAGQPVHADGTLAQNFLQAHKLTQPVVYSSQELNSETGAYLSAAALAVLPEGYALFDPTATYQVWVGSGSGEGSNVSRWLISGDNTTNTTCVVGFGEANDYSYVRDVQNTNTAYKGYDYTHTTVYFAVKWVVGAVQDTVVIDYGLPVDISVMGNDMFGAHGTLYAVGNRLEDGTVPAYGSTLATGFSTSSVNGTYGTATLNNGKVRYKLNSMTMPHSEKLAYAVDYQGDANKGYYYGAITVIPATTVYFEDEYVDLTTYKDKTYNEVEYTADSNKTITYYELKDGKYKIVLKPEIGKKYYTVSYTSVEGWPTDSVAAGGVQAEDRPGFHNLPIIDQNNIYGYDQAYDQMSTYSMGTSAMINVNAEQYGTAEFSFYGTGFDVISTTSNQTGTFVVDIYAGTGDSKTLVTSKAVDTYYGYVYGLYNVVYQKNDNGVWVLVEVGDPAPAGSPNQSKDDITGQTPNQNGTVTGTMYTWKPVTNNPNALYQVPVITHSGLTYGQYTVVVSALYYSAFDATTAPGYDLYLDAIRIYNPAGTTYDEGNKDGNIDDDIQKAYTADGEAWPSYQELRNLIISAATFDALNGDDEEVHGIVFIDGDATLGKDGTVTGNAITDYINYGPNNELYLAKDQAVAFNMNMGSTLDHEGYVPVVRIGLKTVGGNSAIAEMWNTQVTKDEDGKVVSVNRYNTISDKLETATDMYYDITVLNNKTVVIKNSGEDGSILSITNIKLTYKPTVTSTAGINETAAVNDMEQGDTSMKLTISKSAAKAALMSLAPAAQEELPEPSVPETTEPQEPVPEETVSDRLKAAVAAAKLLKEKDYTEKSFKALTTARKAAEKVLKDKKATEAKLEAALKALDAAVAALEAKADVTELKAAVAAAKKLKEKDYTAVSYKAVTTACKVAEKLMRDKNATQVKADEALEALNAAVAALEARADVTELKAAVDAAKKLKEKNYTPFSYKAVTTARKAAEKVMKDKNANQAAADAALEVLNAAVAALEAKPNLTALKTAVNAAKKLKEKNYTLETYEAVTTARKAAEKVMKDKNANQAAVDAALAELNAAVDALVERDFSVKTIKK